MAKQGLAGPLFEKLIDGGLPALLEQNEHKQSLLHIAAEHGQKAVVKLLLLHSAMGIDMVDAHGSTPLLLAALHKRIEVCEFLLRKVRLGWNVF
jgi:ankyrin repeat protein